jgi:TonB-linked SusC/RagA family outer membrane protein
MKKKLILLNRDTWRKRLCLLCILGCCSLAAFAQKRVTGTVIDTNGEPVIGANVIEKGTTNGNITDISGMFSLDVAGSQSVLEVSFIGYTTQEIEVGSQTHLAVMLAEDTKMLEEVVVVGYGTMKKSDLTGSVQQLKGDQFKNQTLTQATEMLAGTVAGFNSVQGGSAAGGASMEIRGPKSLLASNEPLVVVDGSIYYGSLSDINPYDIETIDVLKDASSAAVYGAKAAAGVIQITTKRGKAGKPLISASVKVGMASSSHNLKTYDGEGYIDFRTAYLEQLNFRSKAVPEYYYRNPDRLPSGIGVNEWLNYSNNPNADPTVEYLNRLNFWPTEVEQYQKGEEVNWLEQQVGTGLRQDYTVGVSGASDRVNYYFSVGYVNNEGFYRGDAFAAVRPRLNLDFKITDWLNVGLNTQYSYRDQSSVAVTSLSANVSPYAVLFNLDGTPKWYPSDYAANPLINYYEQDRLNVTHDIFTRMYAKLNLPFGFNYEIAFQPHFSFNSNLNFWNSNTITGGSSHANGYATRAESRVQDWNLDHILHWDKTFGVHNLHLTLLYNARKYQRWSSTNTNESFFPNENLSYHALQLGNNPSISNSDSYETAAASMARINYSLMDKYLLTASVRRDGYSAFGKEHPWAVFPAAALAWVISNEAFYNQDWFANRLKLRASWGVNGNSAIDAYAALAGVSSEMYSDGSSVKIGVFNNSLANYGLRWERIEAINLGLDIGLLKNRVDMSIEMYNMNTTDLLMPRKLPQITGFTQVTANLGEVNNRGIELTLNTVNIDYPDMRWSSNFIFSMNRNKIVHLFGDYEEVEINGRIVRKEVNDYDNKWFIGQPKDVVWDYEMLGVWQMEEEAGAADYHLYPGDLKARDVDGNHVYDALTDKQFIGYRDPRFHLGTTQTVRFLKNFTASVFLRADLGHIAQFDHALHNGSEMFNRMSYWDVPYWTPANRSNDYPGLIHTWQNQYGGGVAIYKPKSFLRVQDMSLSYALPSGVAKKWNLANMSIFCSARNLLTFTKWPGWDPETGMSLIPRIITFGIDISL